MISDLSNDQIDIGINDVIYARQLVARRLVPVQQSLCVMPVPVPVLPGCAWCLSAANYLSSSGIPGSSLSQSYRVTSSRSSYCAHVVLRSRSHTADVPAWPTLDAAERPFGSDLLLGHRVVVVARLPHAARA